MSGLTFCRISNDGDVLARQNVIHEAGLFQRRVGFRRAIVLLEEGVEQFLGSRIRFDEGRMQKTLGDVVATIRREFRRGR